MFEFSLLHFPGEGVVSFVEALWFKEIEFDVVRDFSFSDEICGEHMTFGVFTEEVLIA